MSTPERVRSHYSPTGLRIVVPVQTPNVVLRVEHADSGVVLSDHAVCLAAGVDNEEDAYARLLAVALDFEERAMRDVADVSLQDFEVDDFARMF